MLSHQIDSFKVTDESGTITFRSTLDPSNWALSGAAGLSYAFDTNKEITLDGYLRQVEDGEQPFFAVSAGVTMGF
jgi:hypothetical protein